MTQMADHWWPRPGWRPERTMYAFHVTFGTLPEVGDLAEAGQARLANLPGLDLVPRQWLHLTTQGVAFSDAISPGELSAVTESARHRLAVVDPPVVTIGPAEVVSEGITCRIAPAGALNRLRTALRAAIGETLGPQRLLEDPTWTPHISLAYANADVGPAEIYEAALGGSVATATVRIPAAQLILLSRGDHLYTWQTAADLPLRSGRT